LSVRRPQQHAGQQDNGRRQPPVHTHNARTGTDSRRHTDTKTARTRTRRHIRRRGQTDHKHASCTARGRSHRQKMPNEQQQDARYSDDQRKAAANLVGVGGDLVAVLVHQRHAVDLGQVDGVVDGGVTHGGGVAGRPANKHATSTTTASNERLRRWTAAARRASKTHPPTEPPTAFPPTHAHSCARAYARDAPRRDSHDDAAAGVHSGDDDADVARVHDDDVHARHRRAVHLEGVLDEGGAVRVGCWISVPSNSKNHDKR
jgi:hypothetical protein